MIFCDFIIPIEKKELLLSYIKAYKDYIVYTTQNIIPDEGCNEKKWKNNDCCEKHRGIKERRKTASGIGKECGIYFVDGSFSYWDRMKSFFPEIKSEVSEIIDLESRFSNWIDVLWNAGYSKSKRILYTLVKLQYRSQNEIFREKFKKWREGAVMFAEKFPFEKFSIEIKREAMDFGDSLGEPS